MAAYHRYEEGRAVSQPTASRPAPSLREELRLTDDQARIFTELRGALHERVQALRGEMRSRRRELFAILATPSPDSSAIDRVLGEMNRTQFDMQRVVADYLRAQMLQLTAEQRATFVKSMARQSMMEPQQRRLPLLGPGGARLPDERR